MKKKVTKKLKEIQDSVPKEWSDALMTTVFVAPDLRDEALKTLKEYEDDFQKGNKDGERDYRRLKNLFDAGYYDATEAKVDEEIAKKIEDYVEAEILAAMERGELPEKESDKDLQKYVKKLKKYART
jgi:hypothetical protein